MTKIVRLVQGSDDWHRHRLLYRNASETSAVMGLSPWLTAYQLWEIKTGRRTSEVNLAMQRGTELEPIARRAYEEMTGWIMEPLVVVDEAYSASLDGMSLDGGRILEVKCPFHGRNSDTWKLAEERRLEPHYRFQVQHQLMVTGAEVCDFFVFDGKNGLSVEVIPNPKDFDEIRAAWDEFWRYVTSDSPPPLSTFDTVLREDDAWRSAAEKFLMAKRRAGAANDAMEQAKADLMALTSHTSERGYGVSVSRFWRGPKATKEEVRVTVLKEEQRC